jgi:PAS domain S-box-containing protein
VLRRLLPVRNAALLTALCYVAVGSLWIIFSDQLVEYFAAGTGFEPDRITSFQTIKGLGFIGATGLMIFLLVRHFLRTMERSRAATQRRLEGIATQYERLFMSNPSAMIIVNPGTQQILAVNDASLVLYGRPREELLNMRTYDLVVPGEVPRVEAVARADISMGVMMVGPFHVRRGDGQVIVVEAVAHELEFNGQAARMGLVTDITERIRNQEALVQHQAELEQRVRDRTAELTQANQRLQAEVQERHRMGEVLRAATTAAEAANAAKTTFLANTTHEIRTPLTSILGYVDLLADPALPEQERATYLDIVRQNARHLLALIDDLLDMSRAETGKVRVDLQDQSLREIAQQAVQLLIPRAEAKSLALTLQFGEHLPETIRTDGVRLRQVLLNLLANAIKFTPAGSVRLRVEQVESSNGSGPRVRFGVSDTGIGMAREHLALIFEPFYQIEQGATRRYGGSGLGLAISRQLTHQMGGTLTVASEPGRGTTFTLELPVGTARAPAEGPKNPATGGGRLAGTILLAEDNPNIRLLVDEYLRRAGAHVITVPDGEQAVDRVLRAVCGEAEAIDLVLLDIHMPVLDGVQAKGQMRAAGSRGPIVGLTADFAEKPAEEWAREGWDAMASKPIDRQAFIPLLAGMMARAGA